MSNVFTEFISEKINSIDVKKRIISLYKDKIYKFDDTEFINFFNKVYDKSRYDEEKVKVEYNDYLLEELGERLKKIANKNIAHLFKELRGDDFQSKLVITLKEKLENCIEKRINLNSLIGVLYGDARPVFLTECSEKLGLLSAEEWYKLGPALWFGDIKYISENLRNCSIDGLSFIDGVPINNNEKQMLFLFEENLRDKLNNRWKSELGEDKEKLLNYYYGLIDENVKTEETVCNGNTKIFNDNSLKAISLTSFLLFNEIIDDKNESYVKFKEKYMSDLIGRLEKDNTSDYKITDGLFYRILKGSIKNSDLIHINSLKGLIYADRNDIRGISNEIEGLVNNMTEEQVARYNLKLYKSICEKMKKRYEEDYASNESISQLAMKMFLAFGYDKAIKLLNKPITFTRYEFIINDLYTKNIKLNKDGTPILSETLMNFLFGNNMEDKDVNINRILRGDISAEFKSHFFKVYNNWNLIYKNLNGNVTVSRVVRYFKDNSILLNPNEFKLGPALKEVGTNLKVIEAARNLYKQMRERGESTIPKVKGDINDYEYEMLNLDDPTGLVVGYITRCCFLINGKASSALEHSATSKNGRIFVVRKDGQLIAQSWVWRNGNLLCFDNVETTGSFDEKRLLKTYIKASEELIKISEEKEDKKESLKTITFGGSHSHISKPSSKLELKPLPLPLESGVYTDAEYTQYILATNGKENMYFGEVAKRYKDPRNSIMIIEDVERLNQVEKEEISKVINSINFDATEVFEDIDISKYKYLVYNNDWYIGISNYNIKMKCLKLDERAKIECREKILEIRKKLKDGELRVDLKGSEKEEQEKEYDER